MSQEKNHNLTRITCSNCKNVFSIDLEKLPKNKVKAKCKKCNNIIILEKPIVKPVASQSATDAIPPICPKCNAVNKNATAECDNCGIIFSKYKQFQSATFKENQIQKRKETKKDTEFLKARKNKLIAIAMVGCILFTIILTIFLSRLQSTSGDVTGKVDMTAFGVTLGEPLPNIPRCDWDLDQERCIKKVLPFNLNKFDGDRHVKIRLSIHETFYTFMKDNSFYCRIVDGIVDGISFHIKKRELEVVALKLLIDKYGKPSTLKEVVLQNAFGTKIPSFEVNWRIGTPAKIFVTFERAGTKEREVRIMSADGAMFDIDEANKIRKTMNKGI